MRFLILLLIISCLVCGVNAQNNVASIKVTGKVQDKSGNPVVAASVMLYRLADTSLVKSAITANDGSFSVDTKEPDALFLEISAVGFNLFSKPLERTNSESEISIPVIELAPAPKALAGVTVSSRKPAIVQQMDRTIMNVDASISNTGTSALEVLEKAPGVLVDKDGNISLKGKEGVMIYIDGRPTYLSGPDLANYLKSLSSSQLDQLEIMTNPPASYDAAGNSGVINIKLKKIKQVGYNASITASYTQGLYSRYNESANFNYRKNKLNIFGSVGYNRQKTKQILQVKRVFRDADTQEELSRIEQESKMRNIYTNYNGRLGFDYSLTTKTTVGASFNGAINPGLWKSRTPAYLLQNAKDTLELTDAYTISDGDGGNMGVNLYFRSVLDSSGKELSGNFDHIQYTIDDYQPLYSFYYNKDYQPIRRSDTLLGHLPQKIYIYSGKLDYMRSIGKWGKLETGWKSSYVKTDNNAFYEEIVDAKSILDSARTNHFIYKESIHAGYATISKSFNSKWSTKLGLRVEHTEASGTSKGYEFQTAEDKFVYKTRTFKRSYTELFPTFYLQYAASESHNWVLNYGRRLNRPSYGSLNPFINFLDRYSFQQGNPDLKPQFAHSIEFTHSYKGVVNTTINYTSINDIIQQVFEQNSDTKETIIKISNIAKMRQVGLAVNVSKEFFKIWSVNAYVNANHNRFEGVINNESVVVNQPTVLLQVQQQFKFVKGWNAEITGMYRTKGMQGLTVIQPFGMVHMGVGKSVLKNKGTVRLHVRDIFSLAHYTGISRYSNVDVRFHNINDSRAVTLSFTWRFSKGKLNNQQSSFKKGGADEELDRVGQ